MTTKLRQVLENEVSEVGNASWRQMHQNCDGEYG